MRLGDLVAQLQDELQRGVDAADADRDPDASGPRFAVRRLDVDLPVGVSEVETDAGDGEESDDDGRVRLDVRPGEGDGRLTFRFGPAAAGGGRGDAAGGNSGDAAGEGAAGGGGGGAVGGGGGGGAVGGGGGGGAVGGSGRGAAGGSGGGSFVGDVDPGDVLEGVDGDAGAGGDELLIPAVSADVPAVAFEPSLPADLRAGVGLSVETVEGVGPKRAAALRGMGVTTVAELAAADPGAVAEELATSDAQARRFVDRARFVDLGADAQTAELLVDAGVALDELVDADPGDLLARLRERAASGETPVPASYEPEVGTVERVVELATKRRR